MINHVLPGYFDMFRTFILLTLAIVLALGSSLRAETQTCEPLIDQDVVCFVGDSITHGGLYQKVLRDFYTATYPQRKINYINCGISGDTLTDVLARFDSDIAVHQPTVVFVMLGMNDIYYPRFKPNVHNTIKDDDFAVNAYASHLNQLVVKIKTLNPRQIILLSPTIYDEFTKNLNALAPYPGMNHGLALVAIKAQQTAQNHHTSYIDLHTPMTQWTHDIQKRDPAFSFIHMDRIHPNTAGHYLMAYLILKAMGQTHNLPPIMTTQTNQDDQQPIQLNRWPMTLAPEITQIPELLACFEPMTELPAEIAKTQTGLKIRQISVQLFSQSAHLYDMMIQRQRDPVAAIKFLKGEYTKQPDLPENPVNAAKALIKQGKRGYVGNLYNNLIAYGAPGKIEQTQKLIDACRQTLHDIAQLQNVTVKLSSEPILATPVSQTITCDDGHIAYQPTAGAMSDAWHEHRLLNYSQSDELGVCGNCLRT
jgi:lysophospholipase L1-like esterase